MNSNSYKDQDNRYFKTHIFYTAAYLFVKGLVLVNIDKVTDSKRAYFVFLDTPERELLIKNFSFAGNDSPEVMVDARRFVIAIKTLKDKLYQEGF